MVRPIKTTPRGRAAACFLFLASYGQANPAAAPAPGAPTDGQAPLHYLSKPLIRAPYTADPAVHVFEGRFYLYPSHDIPGVTDHTDGNHYAMRDYHVFSMDRVGAPVTDHGVAFALEDVPWASRQLWAPDVAQANGRYYFYFPARDREQVFRIGVAVGDTPTGPFKPEAQPMNGAYSIDPAAFSDEDGAHYLYFGGIGGGQLQRWPRNRYDASAPIPGGDQSAMAPRVARLGPDLLDLAEPAREILLLDPSGHPLLAGNEGRRFFEGAWVHKRNGIYYFSYSTGTTHLIVYATGNSPQRSLHLSRSRPEARPALDDPALHCAAGWEVVVVLPRGAALRTEQPAQRQGHRTRGRRQHPDDRSHAGPLSRAQQLKVPR